MKPTISVLMSVYNCEKYLKEAIDSVLNQTFTDFEFLIVDDCSSDSSLEIIKSYQDPRIRIFENPTNSGLIKSLNLLIDKSKGKFLARLDSDDIALPERFEVQYNLMNSDNDLVLTGSNCLFIDEHSEVLNSGRTFFSPKKDLDDALLRWLMLFPENHFIHSSVMIRANALRTNNLHYDKAAKHAEDFELWNRLSSHGSLRIMKEPLVKLRILEDSITSQKNDVQIAFCQKLAAKNQAELIGSSPQGAIEDSPTRLGQLYRQFIAINHASKELESVKQDFCQKLIKILLLNLLRKPQVSRRALKAIIRTPELSYLDLVQSFIDLIRKKILFLISYKRPLNIVPDQR